MTQDNFLTFKEKLWFRVKTLEYAPLPMTLRRAMIGRLVPNPYGENRIMRINGRDVAFLHVPKTGGTALSSALGLQHGHVPVSRFIAQDAARFDAALSFAFVRNPWDRLFSAFNYLHSAIGLNQSRDLRWSGTYLARYPNFEAFVLALETPATRRIIWQWPHFRPQADWICLPGEDHVRAKYVGRFENIAQDSADLAAQLGVEIDLPVTRRAQSYAEKRFTPRMISIIGDLYGQDARIFGYGGPEEAR